MSHSNNPPSSPEQASQTASGPPRQTEYIVPSIEGYLQIEIKMESGSSSPLSDPPASTTASATGSPTNSPPELTPAATTQTPSETPAESSVKYTPATDELTPAATTQTPSETPAESSVKYTPATDEETPSQPPENSSNFQLRFYTPPLYDNQYKYSDTTKRTENAEPMPSRGPPPYAEAGTLKALEPWPPEHAKAEVLVYAGAAEDKYARRFRNAGNRAMAWKNYDLAIEKYSAALEISPQHPIILANRCLAWTHKGINKSVKEGVWISHDELDAAIEDGKLSIEIDPTSATAHAHLAGAHLYRWWYFKAVKGYQTAIDLQGDNATDEMKVNLMRAEELACQQESLFRSYLTFDPMGNPCDMVGPTSMAFETETGKACSPSALTAVFGTERFNLDHLNNVRTADFNSPSNDMRRALIWRPGFRERAHFLSANGGKLYEDIKKDRNLKHVFQDIETKPFSPRLPEWANLAAHPVIEIKIDRLMEKARYKAAGEEDPDDREVIEYEAGDEGVSDDDVDEDAAGDEEVSEDAASDEKVSDDESSDDDGSASEAA